MLGWGEAAHSGAGVRSPSIKAGSFKSESQIPSHTYLVTIIYLHIEKNHPGNRTKGKMHRGGKDQEESLGQITEQPKNKVSPDHILCFPLYRTLT